MNKNFFLIAIVVICTMPNFDSVASPTKDSVSISKDRFGKKSKNGSFKRKRSGFLGIFGKKNACDCPRH
jgi:hypothetical protein